MLVALRVNYFAWTWYEQTAAKAKCIAGRVKSGMVKRLNTNLSSSDKRMDIRIRKYHVRIVAKYLDFRTG